VWGRFRSRQSQRFKLACKDLVATATKCTLSLRIVQLFWFIPPVVSSYFGNVALPEVTFVWKRLSMVLIIVSWLWDLQFWFLQYVLKLRRMRVDEQDVFSCFICHGWAFFSLQSWGGLLSLNLFWSFNVSPVSIACRW